MTSSEAKPAQKRRVRAEREAASRDENVVAPSGNDTTDDEAVDEAFVRAARALNYASMPTEVADVAPAAEPLVGLPEMPIASRRPRSVRKLITATTGAAAVAALVAMGFILPIASASFGEGGASATASASTQAFDEDEIQAFVTSAEVENAVVDRAQGYTAESFASVIATAAATSGVNTANSFYENDPRADIQYPFAVGTSMSSGFGQRWGRLHEGIDFTPGQGAQIQSVADGVVRLSTEAGGAFGVTVVIDHVIDGEVVSTRYAHMEYGSLQVQAGQRVAVGDSIGTVGNTGRSFGAHLHFEVHVNDTAIDPEPWLAEYAGTRYSDEESAAQDVALTALQN